MGNVDDRGAARTHAGEHGKQALNLVPFQRSGGLVENEDAALPAHRLGDGHELAFGKAERRDAPVGIGMKVELGQHGARGGAHARAVDQC